MNVKAVVKVMNFHALLRVEASRRTAAKYEKMASELESVMKIILNNKNLRMDKLIKLPDPDKPVLRIYLASDYGFCGPVNSSVLTELRNDTESDKIIIGKKIKHGYESKLYLLQEEVEARMDELIGYMEREIIQQPWSAIEVVYNHYYNMSSIEQVTKRIYPLEVDLRDEKNSSMYEDFMMEGEPEEMLRNMMVTYLRYMLRIAVASSYASENVMRQGATTESLKKIDEIEEEENKQIRKEKNATSFRKTIDSYTIQKTLGKV